MQTTWHLNQLPPLLSAPVTVLGAPALAPSPFGPALRFSGAGDGLIVHANPLRGVSSFTIEALFSPDPNGPAEQRFVHVHDDTADARALLETRVVGDSFYADTFLKSLADELPLNDPKLLHPCARWHTLALVYDGAIMRQYLSGHLELQGPVTPHTFGQGRVSIGCRINAAFWFAGQIHTLRFTLHPLPPDALLQLPAAATPLSPRPFPPARRH